MDTSLQNSYYKYSAKRQVSSVVETTNTETPIYWELNGLDQADPRLIEFLRKNILIPPPGLLEKGIVLIYDFNNCFHTITIISHTVNNYVHNLNLCLRERN